MKKMFVLMGIISLILLFSFTAWAAPPAAVDQNQIMAAQMTDFVADYSLVNTTGTLLTDIQTKAEVSGQAIDSANTGIGAAEMANEGSIMLVATGSVRMSVADTDQMASYFERKTDYKVLYDAESLTVAETVLKHGAMAIKQSGAIGAMKADVILATSKIMEGAVPREITGRFAGAAQIVAIESQYTQKTAGAFFPV